MKKTLTLLALFQLLQASLFAQIQIQLGAGTSQTATTVASPVNIYYRSARSQMVYTAAELAAAGATAGNIVKLGFYIVQAPDYSLPDYSIKIKHTTATDAGVHDSGPFEEVFYSASYAPTEGGFDLLTLDAPFQWNGTDNILIDVCFGLVLPSGSSSGSVRYYSVTNGYRYSRANDQDMCPDVTADFHSFKPQLLLEFSSGAPYDAGALSIDAPADFCAGQHDVVATIANYGSSAIDSVTVNWEFDGVLQPSVSYNTPLDSLGSGNNTAQLVLGNKDFAAGQLYPILVWTSGPNGVADTVNYNDTMQVVVSSGLAGTYSIGGSSPDYPTFAEAAAALKLSGVCGPVTFNVRNGTYNEQLSFPEISGADAANTITFQSESGDSSQVTLAFSASSADNYTVELDGADWFMFKRMSIEATSAAYGRVVVLQNGASHNRFENCELQGFDTGSTLDSRAVVYSPDNESRDEYNVFQNNYLRDGSYGFYWAGNNAAELEQGNILDNNRIENFYQTGIFINYQDAVEISGNAISTNSSYSSPWGINAAYCDNNSRFLRNEISGVRYGLECDYCDGTANAKVQIVNNFVHTAGTATGHGIYSYYGAFQQILHNSVQVRNTAAGSAAFYAATGNNKVVLNNIFANYGGGYAVFRTVGGNVSQSDYNALYTAGPYLGDWNGPLATLSDWQNASLQDGNSLSVNPLFLSPVSFVATEPSLNGAATPAAGVADDIEGQARDAQSPDIGCDEFAPASLDAGVVALLPPEVPFAPGQQVIAARIKNFGETTLASLDIGWEYNGSPQSVVNWTGSLASGDTATVSLGLLDLPIQQSHEIIAWTASPNGMADPVTANDTSSVSGLYAGLSGAYTLGGSSPDFNDFAEAAAHLEQGGVVGPVVFNVRDGAYNEQVVLREMPGTDEAHTVTFQSESGDSSLVTLAFSANFTDNYTMLLDGADWVRFKKMTLEASHTSYARVLELRNAASHNIFESCRFRGQPTSSSSGNYIVIYSGSNGILDEYNTFRNNTILNGSYGFYLLGVSTVNLEKGLVIEDNHIDSCSYRGMYLLYMDAMLVRGNTVTTVTSNVNSIGMDLYYCMNGTEVSKNKIFGFQNAGIYLSGSDASASQPVLITNNFIGVPGMSTGYGIYSNDGSYQNIYYNSVSISSTGADTYGFYANLGNNKRLLNNIFSNAGGGYAVYANSTSAITVSDHNDLYTAGANLGYWSGAQADLAAWTAASGLDSSSVSADPLFAGPADLHISNPALDKQGISVSTVIDDIDGETRDPAVPDIGADEFVTDALDAGLYAIDAPKAPFPLGVQDVRVRVVNSGATALASADIGWEVNGAGQPAFNWTGSLAAGEVSDTLSIGSFDFQAATAYTLKIWVTNPNAGTDAEPANDTIAVSNLYPALAGVYTIGGTSPDFPSFAGARDALIMGGVTGPVVFNVRNGTYNEQVSFPEITGVSAGNTITFQSEAGDSSLVTLTFSSPSTDNYTLQLDGADWFVFKNLTIEATDASYSRVMVLQNAASNNRVENCEMRGVNTGNTSSNRAVVYSPDNSMLDEHNVFQNNLIRQGSYGFFLSGDNNNSREAGNEIFNCRIEDPYYQGIYAIYQDAARVNNNVLITTSSNTDSRGVNLIQLYNGGQVNNNQIVGFGWGILLDNCSGAPSAHIRITNNFVETQGSGQRHGIYTFFGGYQDFLHNTVRQLNPDAGAAAFYAASGDYKIALNNIFANEGGGYAIYRNQTDNLAYSDYNCLYATGPYLAYSNGDIETLAEWQDATSYEGNSISVNPFFLSAGNYAVGQVSLNGGATTLGGVAEDIEGEARDAQAPDIGCDEFTPLATDAGVAEVLPPAQPFANGTHPVSAAIKNFGTVGLASVDVNWTVNGVLQTPVNWTGTIASGDTAIISLGTVDFAVRQEYEIRAWTSLPNGMADVVVVNDTATVSGIYAGLQGLYTIGGASPDFNTFAEAATNLRQGGVTGVVAFNVRDGVYNEQLVLDEITGAGMSSTVTFQSESGDSSLVTLTFDANSTANYTVLLDGADWLRFERLTLEATDNTYGTVLELRNGAAENRFEYCEFRGVSTTSINTSRAVISSIDGPNHNNAFLNNAILDGSYGFYMPGVISGNPETGLLIENNRIENPYYRGMYLRYMEQLLVRSNRISTVSANTSSLGIFLDDCYDGVEASSNRITGFQNGGIYLDNCIAGEASPMLIANNFVQMDGAGTGYGIYSYFGSHQKIYHNSVNVLNADVGSSAFRTYWGNNKDVRNNIFANSGGGYAFVRSSNNGVSYSDYNDLYTSGMFIGDWDGNQPTMADWRTVSGRDLHSISDNPFFVQADSFAVAQISLNEAAIPLPEVATDIEGESRDASNPDIGCDEFLPPAGDAGVSMVVLPPVPFAPGQQPVRAVLKNFGTDTLYSATLNWAVDGMLQTPVAWAGSLLTDDTLVLDLGPVDFSINHAYEIAAWSSLPNGMADGVMSNDSSIFVNVYAGLAGSYTIGGASPDFNAFTEAVDNLNFGGVLDEVAFNVRAGAYNEQLRLTEAPGADSLHAITFQSESGDSSSVVLAFDANSDANYTVMLDGADWIRLKKMTLEATNTSFGTVLDYRNGAGNNRFENCEFRGISVTGTNTNLAVIHSPDNTALDENVVFLNNYVRNGSYGFYLLGDNINSLEKGIRLENNRVENSYYRGVYLLYADAPVLRANLLTTNSTSINSTAAYLNSCGNGVEITKNRIFGYTDAGINLSSVDGTAAEPVLVANNFIQVAGTGTGYGIYSYFGAHHKIYHNTAECINTNAGSTAFYAYSGNNKQVLNNIFVNTGGGYAIYRNSTNGLVRCDHNNLYVTGANLGNWGGTEISDLAAWTAASSLDPNSVSLDPIFIGGTDLHVTNVALDKVGTPVPEVADDIDGDGRDPNNPDCGADEFVTAQNDAAIVSIDSPAMPFAAGLQPVYVTVLNNGLDTLASLTVNWEVNGMAQPPYGWTGTLLSADVLDSVLIGAFPFEVDTSYAITAWADSPNGMMDEDAQNDTARVENLYAALGGIYTLGGMDPDFPDFASAVNALIKGGVIDEVVFNVRDGVYAEQLSIPEIMGASMANNITFQSESGDSTAVRLTYDAATNTENYTIQLDGADWMRFERMTLENASSSYGRVLDIRNEASNNRFARNEIIGADINSVSTFFALVYSSTAVDNDNTFANNRLLEGSYGFYYSGVSTFTLEAGTRIEGNHFEGQYFHNMYLYYQDAPLIEANTVVLANSQVSADALYCNTCNNGLKVAKNTFNAPSGDNGIALENCTGTSVQPGLVANNFVEISSSISVAGIWLRNSGFQNIYHNSVSISSSNSGSVAFYVDGGNNIKAVNNILANTGSGRAYYSETADNITASNYNDLYATGASLGYWNAVDATDLPVWQTITGLDVNSISVDPLFESATDLHVGEVGLNNAATPLSEVTDDIDGEARNPLTPDIGADEFAPISNNDAGIVEIAHPSPFVPFAAGNQPVDVVIRNNGSDTITSAAINWYVNGSAQAVYNWTGFLEPGDRDTLNVGDFNFALKFGYDILAFTSMPDGMVDSLAFNDSTLVTDLYAGLDGVYTIGGVFPDFSSFSEAANVLNRGGVLGPVTLNVRNGTYDDQISLNEIRGAGVANTVTFQSESGDSSLVTLANSISSPDYTVQLNGADYVTFRNMTLEASDFNASTVIEIGNGASNFQLLNNRIIAPDFANDIMVKSVGNSLDPNLVFRNNLFRGGWYAIELQGQSTGQMEPGALIEGNTFEAQRNGAVSMIYMDAPAIRSNTISGAGSGSSYIGLYLRYCDNGLDVSRNKISHSGEYGVYLYFCDGASGDRGLTANNFIHLEGADLNYGIYAYSSNFQNIYYNNIHVVGTNPSSRAFYAAYGGNNNLLNNVLANSGGGYAIYTNSNGNLATSNHNDLYATGPWLGYWTGSNAADLAGWQSLSGKDNNSVSANPLFYSATDLHVLQVALDSAATSIPGITEDVDGDIRQPNFPDIGADEFDYLEDDLGIISLLSPQSACDLSNAETVKVVIQNFGGLPQTGFDVAYSLSGGTPVVENVGGLVVQPGDTIHYTFSAVADVSIYTAHVFEVETQLAGDLNPDNDTLTVVGENFQTPAPVANMLPADGADNISPPINFSWFPSLGASRYDFFFWLDTLPPPVAPTAPDLTQITYVYNSNNLAFGETYNWQVIAKNDYCQTPGPIQSLQLRELPDLLANNVSAPASPFSGQQIQVSWQVDNNGLGSTGMASWIDAVYLSTDNTFQLNADTYLGGVANLAALSPGQMYAQTANVTLPEGIQGQYYIFIYSDRYGSVDEEDEDNNISSGPASMLVNLTPPPDLEVASIIAPNNAFSGQPINVTWVVKNDGAGDMEPGNTYRDWIFISDENVFNPANSTLLGTQVHTASLAAGASDTLSRNVTLPQGIFGDHYIHIQTDVLNQVYEYVFEDNNTGTSDTINVILTPPPDLVVTSITPPDSASNRENVSLQWTVQNAGGSDATGSWLDRVFISPHDVYDPDSITSLGFFFRPQALAPGGSYTQTRTVAIPAGSSGPNYFYVTADFNDNVFEFMNEGNNTARSSDSTFVKNADLVVSSITIPANTNSGQAVTVQWTVRNNGPGDVISSNRTDKIFLSGSAVYDPMSATELGFTSYNTFLAAGDSLFRQKTVTLPNGISGPYYIHVVTDFADNVFENQNEGNNATAAATTVTLSPWPDLRVTLLAGLPDTTVAGTLLTLEHTVQNFGAAAVQSSGWTDKIYISPSPVWLPQYAVLLEDLSILQPVGIGGAYTISTDFILPMLGNNAATGICYIYVYTDGDDDIFEHTDEGNNILRSNPIYVTAPPPVDLHILNTTTLPDTVWSGQQVNLQWMGQNKGSSTALWNYPLWYDGVYLCVDSVWHPDYEDFIKDFTRQGPLGSQETYSDNQFFNIPNGVSGDYYFFLVADHTEYTNNILDSNSVWKIRPASDPNSLQAKPIHIELSPSPDLWANTFVAPSNGVAGQPIQVSWTVANTGSGTASGTWTDKVYLSTDFVIDQGDPIIGTKSQSRTLAGGSSYQDALQVFLPSNSQGNYVLIFKTDANNTVFEYNGENNNTFFAYLTVAQQPPSDLVVTDISAGSMAMVGEPYAISYTIRNDGANPAAGVMRDLLYFSADSVFDASDVRFTPPISRSINLAPQASLANNVMATTPGLPLGEYFIIAHTDILDNIVESDNANNIRISTQKVMVTVQELPMDVPTADILIDNQNLYYRIEIPDSLENETMLLTLDALPAGSVNELYLSYGQIPTRASHGFAFSEPFAPDQEILVPELQAGTYYLLAYGSTAAGGGQQDITLHAQIINFSLREIMAGQGGNTGNVTVRLDGAKFTPDMTVSLDGPGLGTIFASGLAFINSTRVFVTFPLGGAALGVYNVAAEKPGGEMALLADAFEVVAGDLGTSNTGSGGGGGGGFFCNIVNVGTEQNMSNNLAYPPQVRLNRLVPITIQFGNNGNVDIPCPARFIISLRGAPLSLIPNEFGENLQELYLVFEEPGGPPGVLRPGASSSITVYSFSSHPLRFVIRE